MEDLKKHLVETKRGSYLPVLIRLKLFQEANKGLKCGITTSCMIVEKNYVTYRASLINEAGTVLFSVEHTEPIRNNNFAKTKNRAQLGAIGKLLALIGFGTDYAIELKSDIIEETDGTSLASSTPQQQGVNKAIIKNLLAMIQTLNDLYPERQYTLETISQKAINKQLPENEEEAKKVKKYIQQILDEE